MGDVLSRLRPDQLASLMRVATDPDGPVTAQDEPVADVLAAMLCEETRFCESSPTRLVSELLICSDADLTALTALKNHMKVRSEREPADSGRAAATAIYYAAIAAALVSHGEKITEHGHHDLAGYFDVFVAKPWVTADLKTLLEKARDACQTYAGEDGAVEDV